MQCTKTWRKVFFPTLRFYTISSVEVGKSASTQTSGFAGFQEKTLKWDFCADTIFSLWVPNDKTSKFTVKLPPLHSCGKFVTPVPCGRPGCHVGLSRPIRSKRSFFFLLFLYVFCRGLFEFCSPPRNIAVLLYKTFEWEIFKFTFFNSTITSLAFKKILFPGRFFFPGTAAHFASSLQCL